MTSILTLILGITMLGSAAYFIHTISPLDDLHGKMEFITNNETPMMNEEAPVQNPEIVEPEKKEKEEGAAE